MNMLREKIERQKKRNKERKKERDKEGEEMRAKKKKIRLKHFSGLIEHLSNMN